MKKRLMVLAAVLVMVPVAAAAVLAQSEEESAVTPGSPGVQYRSEPEVCPHVSGEFLVGYDSEEAFLAAPRENVVDTFDSIFVQHLAYPEIKEDPDPSSRSAAEEAKRQELLARPGVSYVEYDCVVSISGS